MKLDASMVDRPRIWISLLLLTILSGCSGQQPPSGGEPLVGLPALSIPWGLSDCDFAVILVDVPAADVAHLVPEGFRVQSVAEVALGGQTGQPVPNPRNDGNLGLELFRCADGTGLPNETLDGVSYASIFIGVEPPADLRRDVDNHFVKLETLVPDDARRELLAAYGLPVVDGDASFPLSSDTAGYAYQGDLEMNGTRYQFQGVGLAPLSSTTFAEFTQTPHGLAVWSMEYGLASGGGGAQSVTVPAGSRAAGILGAGTHYGGGFAGRGTFHSGMLELPAVPAAHA